MIRKLQQSINSKLLAKLTIYLHSAKTLEPQFLCFSSFSYPPTLSKQGLSQPGAFSEIEDQASLNEHLRIIDGKRPTSQPAFFHYKNIMK